MSTVQKKQVQPKKGSLKKTNLKEKKGSLKTSKKHPVLPDKIFRDDLLAKKDCKNDIRKIEEDSEYYHEKYLEDMESCKTSPDEDDLKKIDDKYKMMIGGINYDINCLEQDNSSELRSIEKRFANLISIFIRKYLIGHQIKCTCPHQTCRSQDCDSDYDYDDYPDVESFINAVRFNVDNKPESAHRMDWGYSGYYYPYSSDDDEDKRQPSLSEVYTADTKIYQCLCFDTILNYLIQYQNFMSEINKQHIPKTPKVIDLSMLCEINVANMMSIPSLKSTLSANIANILQVKKLDTYKQITFNNQFGYDKKTKFAKIEKVLKALKEYKADGNIQSLMCIDAQKLKKELDSLRKIYSDKVNECNMKYKNLISPLQKQSKDLYQQRSDEITHFRENLISLHTAENPNYKEYLALQTECMLYL